AESPKEMQEEILESYDSLDTRELDKAQGSALDILKNSTEPVFVAVRSSATTEDLAEASFAGQQDSFVNIKGNEQLLEHIKKCFASLFTSRATYYRNKQGFKDVQASLAVVVQRMVDSDKSGVIFSKDPSYKREDIFIEAVWGLGEGIVSGQITPDNYVISKDLKILSKTIANKKIAIKRSSSGEKTETKLSPEKSEAQVLTEYEIKKLSEIALQLEEHYQKPQDIEFAIEGENISIVQTRPITTIAKRLDFNEIKGEIKGEVILQGQPASPGIAVGKIKIVNNLEDLQKVQQGDILVTKMTNPDMVVTMQKSAGIVTDEGGMTAHAAIVSREMGIPCIVGTQTATTKLKEGEIITVDGSSGKVYKGKVAESAKKAILPVTAETKVKVKVIVDLPSFAERAAKTKLNKVGLTRIEGIISESGKHPNYFLEQNKEKDYEEIIFKGISEIAKYFDGLWVRTSDIRSDEFQNLEGAPKIKEANPMLGMHGIRYSLKNPKIFLAELNALKRVAEQNKEIGFLFPQVISVEEVREIKKYLQQIKFDKAKLGVMIETPAAVQIIKDLCEEGINFISFGTNDLTQYFLAIDRGNSAVQHLYNEMNPGMLYQLAYVIRTCKRYKVETSICGQAGSKKEMVKYLVESGIDSITTNADMAKEISDYIEEIETGLVKGTDKEPRQYQPEKKEVQNDQISNEQTSPTTKAPDNPETESLVNTNQSSSQDKANVVTEEQKSKDIESIEQEKQEYLESEEEGETIETKEPQENIEENLDENLDEIAPQITENKEEIKNAEDSEEEFLTPQKIDQDIEAIEQEKKEYLESKEGEEEPKSNSEEKLDIF
ncbi:MAG: phosphoenolpyruvate synthase, partial [Nanoarchaeota archaeon]|nr:phosphoenolpyruvate synthase [Nanoarchaeota archaeon]